MRALWLLVSIAGAAELAPQNRLEELRPLWLALVAAILLGAMVIYLFDRWRKRSSAQRMPSGDQLTQFRVLYEQGELSRDEYERIRARLGQRIREEIEVPAPPAEGSPPDAPAGELSAPEPPETDIRPA
jgi:hypothetical protein